MIIFSSMRTLAIYIYSRRVSNMMSLLLEHGINFFPMTIGLIIFTAIMLLTLIVTYFSRYAFSSHLQSSSWISWMNFAFSVVRKPVIVLLFSMVIYTTWNIYQNFSADDHSFNTKITTLYLLKSIEYFIFLWIIINFLRLGKRRILKWSLNTNNKTLAILLPALSSSLQAAVLLMMLNILLPQLSFIGNGMLFIEKIAKVSLIMVIGWIFFQATNVIEKFLLYQYDDNNQNFLTARKIRTQVRILKRVILTIGFIVTLGACLMVFDSVKNIGTGLLTTAGIISAIGAFASQQSLSRLFAGLQIAFTQPIRIGDTVIVDKEFGEIEEITLSYIVIKIWDLRKLILPTDYFTSKGIQNLTRDSTQLLGTIFIYTDYTLPIDPVREKFQDLLSSSKFWDKKVSALQVTDIKESSLEIRALMSAENASALWSLRCEIREKLIKFIVNQYPQCLTKTRTFAIQP